MENYPKRDLVEKSEIFEGERTETWGGLIKRVPNLGGQRAGSSKGL